MGIIQKFKYILFEKQDPWKGFLPRTSIRLNFEADLPAK